MSQGVIILLILFGLIFLVGAGAIGKRVIEILKVFGADVITYNRNPKNIDGVKDVTLDELLSESDIVTLHCPLNDSTKGLISAEKITAFGS